MRFLDLETPEEDEAETRERKLEDLIRRLSRFVERKLSDVAAVGRNVLEGARGWIWPVILWWRRVRADGLGAWGA